MKAGNITESGSKGCDFIVSLPKKETVRLLQITDMQFIDAGQRRTADRLRIDEINAWNIKNSGILCKNHIKSLIAQSNPDLIFITGDMVYGSFDDNGTVFEDFCEFMDSFEIPWAPVFGNHDNETKKGVKWQCEQLEKSRYCLFKRGNVSGNGNYTVGIAVDGELVRMLHMLDSNGCSNCDDTAVIKKAGIFADQMDLILKNSILAEKASGKRVPSFVAFHIPVSEFEDAEVHNGYKTDDRELYTIGVDVRAKKRDFGFKMERYNPIKTDFDFLVRIKACGVDGVFAGHCHSINTVIEYENIKWVFGLKTGQYDYHIPGQIGGTVVTLTGDRFEVAHIPSLVHYAPFPSGAKMFENFFAEEKFLTE